MQAGVLNGSVSFSAVLSSFLFVLLPSSGSLVTVFNGSGFGVVDRSFRLRIGHSSQLTTFWAGDSVVFTKSTHFSSFAFNLLMLSLSNSVNHFSRLMSYVHPVISEVRPLLISPTGSQFVTFFGMNFGYSSSSSTMRIGDSSSLSSMWISSSCLLSKFPTFVATNGVKTLAVSLPSLYFSLNASSNVSFVFPGPPSVVPAFDLQCRSISDTILVEVEWRVNFSAPISTVTVFASSISTFTSSEALTALSSNQFASKIEGRTDLSPIYSTFNISLLSSDKQYFIFIGLWNDAPSFSISKGCQVLTSFPPTLTLVSSSVFLVNAATLRFSSRSASPIFAIEFNCMNSSEIQFITTSRVPYSAVLNVRSEVFFNRSTEGYVFCAFRPIVASGLQGSWSSLQKIDFFSQPETPIVQLSTSIDSIIVFIALQSPATRCSVDISKTLLFYDKLTFNRACAGFCPSNFSINVSIPFTQLKKGTRYFIRSKCLIDALESTFSRPITFDFQKSFSVLFLGTNDMDLPKINHDAFFFASSTSCSDLLLDFAFALGDRMLSLGVSGCLNVSSGVILSLLLPRVQGAVSTTLIATHQSKLLYSRSLFIGSQLQGGPSFQGFVESPNLLQIARSPYFSTVPTVWFKSVILVPANAKFSFGSVFLGPSALIGEFSFISSRLIIYSARINISELPFSDNIVFATFSNGVNFNRSETFSLLPSSPSFRVFPYFIVDDDIVHTLNVTLYNSFERIDRLRLSAVSGYGSFVEISQIFNVYPYFNIVQLKCRLLRAVPTFQVSLIVPNVEPINFLLRIFDLTPRIILVSPMAISNNFAAPVVLHLNGQLTPSSVQFSVLQRIISVKNIIVFDAYALAEDVKQMVENAFNGDPDFLAAADSALGYWKNIDYYPRAFTIVMFSSPVISDFSFFNPSLGPNVTAQISVSFADSKSTPQVPIRLKIANLSCDSSLLEFFGVFYKPGSVTVSSGGVVNLFLHSSSFKLNSTAFAVFCVSTQRHVESILFARSAGNIRLTLIVPAELQGHTDFILSVSVSEQCVLSYSFYVHVADASLFSVSKTLSDTIYASKGPREFMIAVKNLNSDSPEDTSMILDTVALHPNKITCSIPACSEALLAFVIPNLSSMDRNTSSFILIHGLQSAVVFVNVLPDPVEFSSIHQVIINNVIGPNFDAMIEFFVVGLLTANSSELMVVSDIEFLVWKIRILHYNTYLSRILVSIGLISASINTPFFGNISELGNTSAVSNASAIGNALPALGDTSVYFTLRQVTSNCAGICELNSSVAVQHFDAIVPDFIYPKAFSALSDSSKIYVFVRNVSHSSASSISANTSNLFWNVSSTEFFSLQSQVSTNILASSLVVLSLVRNQYFTNFVGKTLIHVSLGSHKFVVPVETQMNPVVAYVFPTTMTPSVEFYVAIDNFPSCATSVNVSFLQFSIPASWSILQWGSNQLSQSLVRFLPPHMNENLIDMNVSIFCSQNKSLWNVSVGSVAVSQVTSPVLLKTSGASLAFRGSVITVEVIGVPDFWHSHSLIVIIGDVLSSANFSLNSPEDPFFRSTQVTAISITTPELPSGTYIAQVFDAKNVNIQLTFEVTYAHLEAPRIMTIVPSQITQFESVTIVFSLLIPENMSFLTADIGVRLQVSDEVSFPLYFELLPAGQISVFCPPVETAYVKFLLEVQGNKMNSSAIRVIGAQPYLELISPSVGFTNPFVLTVSTSAFPNTDNMSDILALVHIGSHVCILAASTLSNNVDGTAVISFETRLFPFGGTASVSLRNTRTGVFLNFSYPILQSHAMVIGHVPAVVDSTIAIFDFKIENFAVVEFLSTVRVSFCEQWLLASDFVVLASNQVFTDIRIYLPACPSNKLKSLHVLSVQEPSKSLFVVLPSQRFLEVLKISPNNIKPMTLSKVYILLTALVDHWQSFNADIGSTQLLDVGRSNSFLYAVELFSNSSEASNCFLTAFNGSNSVSIEFIVSSTVSIINSVMPSSGAAQGGYLVKLSPIRVNADVNDFNVAVGPTEITEIQIVSQFLTFTMIPALSPGPVVIFVSDKNTSSSSSVNFVYTLPCNFQGFCSGLRLLPNLVLLASEISVPSECSVSYCIAAQELISPQIDAVSSCVGYANDPLALTLQVSGIVATQQSDVVFISALSNIKTDISSALFRYMPPYSSVQIRAILKSNGYLGDATFLLYSKSIGSSLNTSLACSFLPTIAPETASVVTIAPAQAVVYQDSVSVLITVSNFLFDSSNIVNVNVACVICRGSNISMQSKSIASRIGWGNASVQVVVIPPSLYAHPSDSSIVTIRLNSPNSSVIFNMTILPVAEQILSVFPSFLLNSAGSFVRIQFVGLCDYNSSSLCVLIGNFSLRSDLEKLSGSTVRFISGILDTRLPINDDPSVLQQVRVGHCLSKTVLIENRMTILLSRPRSPLIVSMFPSQMSFRGGLVVVSLINVGRVISVSPVSTGSLVRNVSVVRALSDFEWSASFFFDPYDDVGESAIVIRCVDVSLVSQVSLSLKIDVTSPPTTAYPSVVSSNGGSIITVISYAFYNQPTSAIQMRISNSEVPLAVLNRSSISFPELFILRLPPVPFGLFSFFVRSSETLTMVSTVPLQVTLRSSVLRENSPLASMTVFLNNVRIDDDVAFHVNGISCSSLLVQSNVSARQLQLFPPPLAPGAYVLRTSLRAQSGFFISQDSEFSILAAQPIISLLSDQKYWISSPIKFETIICRGLGVQIISVRFDGVPMFSWNVSSASSYESIVQISLRSLQSGTRRLTILGSSASASMDVSVYDAKYGCVGACRLRISGGSLTIEGSASRQFDSITVSEKGSNVPISFFQKTANATFVATVSIPNLTNRQLESRALVLDVTVFVGNFAIFRGIVDVQIDIFPVAASAVLNPDGSRIVIEFDQPVSLLSRCDHLFDLKSIELLGRSPSCSLVSATRLTVIIGFESRLQAGDELIFTQVLSNQSITVSSPMFPQAPAVKIIGPASFSMCTPTELTAVVTNSRAVRFVWSSIDGASQFSQFLSSQQDSTVTINPSLFDSGKSVTVTVKVVMMFGAVSESSLQIFPGSQSSPKITLNPLVKSTFTVDDDVLISLRIEKSDCYVASEFITRYNWICENCQAQESDRLSKYLVAGSNELYFPVGLLRPSFEYQFRVTVAVGKFTSSAVQAVRVVRRPLRLVLIGGNRTVPNTAPIMLNASASVDPDGDQSLSLSYRWSCSTLVGLSCRLNDARLLELSGSSPIVPASQLPATTFKFVLIVTAVDGRTSSTEFSITVVLTSVPSFGISLNPAVALKSRSLLIKVDIDCNSCRYSWNVITGNLVLGASVLDQNIGGISNSMLRILPDVLISSSYYEFGVTVTDSIGASSTSKVSFVVNSPPSGGSCAINATIGRSNDIFAITCIQWMDPDIPVRYHLQLSSAVALIPLVIPFSNGDAFNGFLPIGNWNMTVSICDSLGSCTFFQMPAVTVSPNVEASVAILNQRASLLFSLNDLGALNNFMGSISLFLVGISSANTVSRSLLNAGIDLSFASNCLLRYASSAQARTLFSPDSALEVISMISDTGALIFLQDSVSNNAAVSLSLIIDCLSALSHVWSSSDIDLSSDLYKSGAKYTQFVNAVFAWLSVRTDLSPSLLSEASSTILQLSSLSSKTVGKSMLSNQQPLLLSTQSSNMLDVRLYRMSLEPNRLVYFDTARLSSATASFVVQTSASATSDVFVEVSTASFAWPFRKNMSVTTIILPQMHSVLVYDMKGSYFKSDISVKVTIPLPSSSQIWLRWSLRQRMARMKVVHLNAQSGSWDSGLCSTISVLDESIASSCSVTSSFAVVVDPAVSVCGDKDVQYPEECDDGNVIDGDGCSSTCLHEIRNCTCQSPHCVSCVALSISAATGGTYDVQTRSGQIQLSFPPQAIKSNAVFQISSSSDDVVFPKSSNSQEQLLLSSSIFTFEPSTTFLKPVKLTLPVTKGTISGNMYFYTLDSNTMSWKRESSGQTTSNPVNRTVTDSISHFSSWAVFEVKVEETPQSYIMPDWLIATIVLSGLILVLGYPLFKFVKGRNFFLVSREAQYKVDDDSAPPNGQLQQFSLDEDQIVVDGKADTSIAPSEPAASLAATPFSKKGKGIADSSFWNQQSMVLSDSIMTPKFDEASDASLDAMSVVFGEEAASKDVWESFLEDIDADEISVGGHVAPVVVPPLSFDAAGVPLPPVESKESRLQRFKQSFADAIPVPPESPQQPSANAPFIRSVSDKHTVAAAVASSVLSNSAAAASFTDAPGADGLRMTANSDRLRSIARARIEQAQQRARARQQEKGED